MFNMTIRKVSFFRDDHAHRCGNMPKTTACAARKGKIKKGGGFSCRLDRHSLVHCLNGATSKVVSGRALYPFLALCCNSSLAENAASPHHTDRMPSETGLKHHGLVIRFDNLVQQKQRSYLALRAHAPQQ